MVMASKSSRAAMPVKYRVLAFQIWNKGHNSRNWCPPAFFPVVFPRLEARTRLFDFAFLKGRTT